MDTVLRSRGREVVVSTDRPFVIIGERINPTGRKVLAAEMKEGKMDRVRADAIAQVAAGAHMLDVNAGIPQLDEAALLVAAIKAVSEVTDVPICIDSSVIEALEAGLAAYEGKALVNSVTGAPPTAMCTLSLSPAFVSASMLTLNIGIVVVRKAEKPNTSG